MDASMPSALVLAIVFALVALYALYFVIRAAVRDGIWLARAKETAKDPRSGPGRRAKTPASLPPAPGCPAGSVRRGRG
ncbi:hypothetical protein DQ353_05615 [Arthrobacter sp. AQ5-05]|uniref:hypothetical protein n=1 Tax=Arthrobacter sp. AQ5-05 TaxID=2184581 RepID=UPI000DCEF9A9|nr:hypothetical protein [Arthrobacter sp. AQ5-05]RAX50418.1 hypothetical protein DQ353_05615 [Arthrobacter sp. AQ5-05]